MPAANYDIEIEQGASYNKQFVYRDSAGALVDLTGITARMQVRPNIKSTTVLIELTTANNRIVIDGPAGSVTINLTATETAEFDWRKGVYDLELVTDADNADRFIYGTLTVIPEVTR